MRCVGCVLILVGLALIGKALADALPNAQIPAGQILKSDGSGTLTSMPNVLTVIGRAINVAVSPGVLTLLGTKDVAVSVPGVLLGDTVMCNLASAPNLSGGVTMSECHVSAADTVTFRFSALVGLTLGTFNYNVIWLR